MIKVKIAAILPVLGGELNLLLANNQINYIALIFL
jgi:hypothetical protein